MKNLHSNPQLETEFIKDTQASVPDIIKNLNPVIEKFDAIPASSEQEPVVKASQAHQSFLHHLLSDAKQSICDLATD